MMRHGEKPAVNDKEQLTCKGFNRSLALPQFLYSHFGKPDYIFAPTTNPQSNKPYSHDRIVTTILPTAIQLGMPVNNNFYEEQIDLFVNELIGRLYHKSLIFVTWEHNNLQLIAKRLLTILGKDPDLIPPWQEDDFDRIYIITINWKNGFVKVVQSSENLSGSLSSTCPTFAPKENEPVKVNETETIYFVPSAEAGTYGQLNCQGLNRAIGLTQVLTTANLGAPVDAFLASSPNGLIEENNALNFYYRDLMTVDATVIDQGTALYTLFGYQDTDSMSQYLLSSDFFNDKTLVVAWNINLLPELAKKVFAGAGGNPNVIPDTLSSHDIMYKIVLTRDNGAPVSQTFSQVNENLTPSPICPSPISFRHG